jgi:hypothetical protein
VVALHSIPKPQEQMLVAQLQRILESGFFRNSQRCSRFLEYSVRHLLEHQPSEELKERRIGMDVFGRPADYDTARDNIVRVTANEVRKRLAQYYGSLKSDDPIVIEMPPGAYVVTVRESTRPEETEKGESGAGIVKQLKAGLAAETSKRSFARRWVISTCLAMAIALVIGVDLYRHFSPPGIVEQVWSPLLKGPTPVLISIAEPIAYEPTTGSTIATGPVVAVVRLPDSFVGVGDAFAMSEIARFLTATGRTWRLVASNEVPSQELRSGPIVLIGAHSNLWTSKLMGGLRYSFGLNNTVVDNASSTPMWALPNLHPDWQTSEDYAIVSRFRSPQTGQAVVIVAGLTNSGTQAAGEFITSPDLLSAALAQAPKGWQNKNFQFVLHTRLIGHTPDRPTVVASYFW